MAFHNVTYNREKLYGELWREPATAVAKRYAISDVALAKICKRLDVPRPPRGYWARRAVGDIDPTPPLPHLKGATDEVEVVRKGRWPDRERIAESLYEGRAAPGAPIVVPDRLAQPHPLVMTALSLLKRAKVGNGLATCREESCLDIAVSPPLLPRAARIMNTLILALEERGFPVEVTDVIRQPEPDHEARSHVTRTLVCGEWLRFAITEERRQYQPASTAKPPRGLKGAEREFWSYWNRPRITLIPTGKLVLLMKEPNVGVGVQVSWCDGRRPVESRLNDFVKNLFVVAEAKKQTREADCSWREAFDVESLRNREERERAAEDAQRLVSLRDILQRWREARDVREFLREIRGGSSIEPTGGSELLDWAERYADAIDPATAARGADSRPTPGPSLKEVRDIRDSTREIGRSVNVIDWPVTRLASGCPARSLDGIRST